MEEDHYEQYMRVAELLETGTPKDWERLAEEIPSFPDGRADYLDSPWLETAVGCGSFAAVEWMVWRRVPLNWRDDEGYTILHRCIDSENDDRHKKLELLADWGADLNRQGLNDWTPLHMAAARGDLESIRILMEYGADPTIRTFDCDATPADEGTRAAGRLIRRLSK